MSKNFRVRTEVGKDKKVTFDLQQDFDLLEILSLSLTQNDLYTRMCADFGVVVGRVIANKGYGIPNAKVSIFIPLDSVDANNKVITSLYPYTEPFQKDDNGVRYNLLSPKRSHDCHVPVGTFPTLEDVLNKQEVRYIYDKYYKFTVKTNEAGDFMIYGVPPGTQSIVMDVDLSDIGCFSLLPEDFKIQGFPDSDFDGPRFKSDASIDRLPQIINQTKTIEVSPFWGDEEFCSAAITRVDFDLADNNFSITPTAIFMGGTATDTDKNAVGRTCQPKRDMGELCSLVTQTGLVDCIRYTPFFTEDPAAFGGAGGTVPVLQRYYLPNGGRVILENGTFFCSVEMNLDHVITDEFGMLVRSGDPEKGVPTRARCRFRIRANKTTSGQQVRAGNYLVPNIREFNTDAGGSDGNIDSRSYAFSIKYSDYHPYAQRYLMPGADDVFYDMTYNKVYTPSQFHDKHKQFGRQQFLGIKEILPEAEQQCSTSAMFFPINSAVRKPNFMIFLYMFLLDFLSVIYKFLIVFIGLIISLLGVVLAPIFVILGLVCEIVSFWNSIHVVSWGPPNINIGICNDFCWNGQTSSGNDCQDCMPCRYFGINMGFILFTLRQTKYPECEKCKCRTNVPNHVAGDPPTGSSFLILNNGYDWNGCDCEPPICNGGDGDTICCPDDYGFNSEIDTPATPEDGLAGGGCYVKTMCFNPMCSAWNTNTRVIDEYNRREKIAVALCNGIMNYFWEYSWVNGFLYQYQFKARLQYDEASGVYTGDYCNLMVYLHPNDNIFYYRSTPFDPGSNFGGITPGNANITNFTFSDDGAAASSWWPSWLTGVGTHAEGDTDKHILTPTTIVDYGPRNKCVQQICLDDKYSEGCSILTQLGSTSFQDITDLVSDIYNMKVDDATSVLSTFFPRPEKRIGGDVAQALMQNCMVGTIGYESNIGQTACDCTTTPPPMPVPPAVGGDEYPVPNPRVDRNGNPNGNPYLQYALNTISTNFNIQWEPKVYTASTPSFLTTHELITCAAQELSSSTQTIPYLSWWLFGSAPFGDYRNDWQFMTGDYDDWFDAGGGIPWWNTTSVSWTNVNSNTQGRYSGPYQNDIAFPWWGGTPGYPTSIYPPLNLGSNNQTVFAQPRFHYFGLRPGETAYNTFIRKFVDEELADTVI